MLCGGRPRRAARRDPQRRRPHRPPEPAPRARRRVPALRHAARARHGRRPDDVLVPGLPAPRPESGLDGLAPARRTASAASSWLIPVAASRSVAVERIWPTITLTEMLPGALEHVGGGRRGLQRRLAHTRRRARGGRACRRRRARPAARSRSASATSGGTFSVSRIARIAPRASTRTLRTARSIRAAAAA